MDNVHAQTLCEKLQAPVTNRHPAIVTFWTRIIHIVRNRGVTAIVSAVRENVKNF